jgi:hypothetical protein
MKLLDAGQDWTIKREEFRSAIMQRVAKTLTIHTPSLSKKSAADIALVVALNVKTGGNAPGILRNFRVWRRG